jgi:hypothetical protein
MKCSWCGQKIRRNKGRVYIVHSNDRWGGFQYRDPDRPMHEDERHGEDNLTLTEARAFLRFFRVEMGFANATAWKPYARQRDERSTSYRRVRL